MARIKLTKSVVENLPTPEQAQVFAWDSVLKGFGVRVSRAGAKTYVAQFKVRGGKERRMAKDVSEDSNPRFNDFANRWLEDVAKRKNCDSTLKHRRLLLDNHVLPELGKKRLTEITQRHIEEMHKY